MSDLIFLCLHELLVIVFFAVHLEYNVDVLSSDQKSLSIVLRHSLLNVVVDDYFLKVRLVILSVSRRLHRESFRKE